MSGRSIGKNVRNGTELIEAVARAYRLDGLLRHHRLFGQWEQIVGRRYADVSEPREIKGATLVVRAADSDWAHDLKMQAPLILEKIAATTGDDRVKRLRVSVGPVAPPRRAPEPPPALETIEVETADIEAAVASGPATDAELRRLIARIWTNGRRLAKRRAEVPR
jgi:hypothetical protein